MRYARNAWYVASWEQDLEPSAPFGVTRTLCLRQ